MLPETTPTVTAATETLYPAQPDPGPPPQPRPAKLQITRFAKAGGPLTKRISLSDDGALVSDGSACIMVRGCAQRVHFDTLNALADLIASLKPHEAIALGALRNDLPDRVEVVTRDHLAKLNGTAAPNVIARTASNIIYPPGQPAVALIDVDTKGMTDRIKSRIRDMGGFWPALVSVLPALQTCGRVIRPSTSACITRTDTGEALHGSNGLHVYVPLRDGMDIERFLRTLHERCWLAGFGWHMLGAGGQLLDRSLVDRTVYAPERLVFEAAPILHSPLIQDRACRKPTVHGGPAPRYRRGMSAAPYRRGGGSQKAEGSVYPCAGA